MSVLFLPSIFPGLTGFAAPASGAGGRLQKLVTVTKTVAAPAPKATGKTARPAVPGKRSFLAEGERLHARDGEPGLDVGAENAGNLADALHSPTDQSHALYARNLCPACPAGAGVRQRSLWDRAFGARAVTYCCPKGGSAGTVTVTVTTKPGTKPTNTAAPPPPPGTGGTVSGRLWCVGRATVVCR